MKFKKTLLIFLYIASVLMIQRVRLLPEDTYVADILLLAVLPIIIASGIDVYYACLIAFCTLFISFVLSATGFNYTTEIFSFITLVFVVTAVVLKITEKST